MFGVMHFLQGERIYVSLFSKAAAIFAAALSAAVIPRIGAWRSLLLGTLIAGLSTVAFIALPGKSGAYVSPLLGSIGAALATPTRMMYMAAVLTPSEITRAQAAISTLCQIFKAPATPIFTALFYGGRDLMDTGYLVSSALVIVSAVSMCWLPRIPPVRDASASGSNGRDADGEKAGLLAVDE